MGLVQPIPPMNAASLVGRVIILFWTCQVLIGDNGFFQGMFQSVTGIPTIDSHFVLALLVPPA
jgi:hypothetical protein